MLSRSPEEKKSSILHRFAYKFNCQKKIPGKFLFPNKLTEDKSIKSYYNNKFLRQISPNNFHDFNTGQTVFILTK